MSSIPGTPAISGEDSPLHSLPDSTHFRLHTDTSPFAHHAAEDIELIESEEILVVRKQSRVVEEVNVRKIEANHTEVIHDSLQHTELAVEAVNSSADGNTMDLPTRSSQ